MDGEDLPMLLAQTVSIVARSRDSAKELREEVARSRLLVAQSSMILQACRQDGRYADFSLAEAGGSIL